MVVSLYLGLDTKRHFYIATKNTILLDQLQNTTEETERNQIATEYNRLTNQVEQLQENEEE